MSQILFRISQAWIDVLLFCGKRKIDFAYWLARHGGPSVELPPDAIQPMLMVGALMELEEKFAIKRQTSKAAALYACLVHNDFPNEEMRTDACLMYAAANKRRAVYDVMLRYKDILPHQVNYLFPGEARITFEDWLDFGLDLNHKQIQ